MAKVLVTGANGFIGSHLVEALVSRGDEVTCLVRRTSSADRLRPWDVRLVYGDVTAAETLPPALAGNRIVYHVAGLNLVLRIKQYYRVNQQGMRNVAETCARQTTPPVLVTVSSLAAAGPAPDGRPRTEADPPTQVSHYGRSKRAGELVAEEFADRVPTTVVRPPVVFGEADPVGLQMFRMVKWFRLHPLPGLTAQKLSIIHATDLAQLLILAAEKGRRLRPEGESDASISAGYYFAACGEDPSYAELGRMIGEALGRRALVVPTLPRTAWIIAAVNHLLGRIRRRPFYLNLDRVREVRAGPWLCSPQAAFDELGFRVQVPLIQRLRQTARWYQQQGWL